MHSYRLKIQSEFLIIVCALLGFICIAGHNISMPGLYYDELLFVNGALGAKNDMFVALRIGNFPLMLMPYIGALKAWIFYPVFKLFGVTAFSIRWPVILIGTLTLYINYRLVKIAFSFPAAIIFIILSCVEPTTIFHTRLDWGPTTLMMLFRSLLLFTIFAWIKTKKPRFLLTTVIIAFLGVFDKLNFIWIVSAAFISLIIVYPDYIEELIKFHLKTAITVAVSLSILLILFVVYTQYVLPLSDEIGSLNYATRWNQVISLLKITVGASGVYFSVTGNGNAISIQQQQLIAIGCSVPLSILVFFISKKSDIKWRSLCFLTCFCFFILLQMFFTKKATGPHHAAMIAPLWVIPISVFLAEAFNGLGNGPRDWFTKSVAIVAMLGISFSSLYIDKVYLESFKGAVRPQWDSGSYSLFKELRKNEKQPAVFVDWGSATIVHGLSQGEIDVKDYWPLFDKGLNSVEAQYFEQELLPLNPLFIVPAQGKETFQKTRKNFFAIASTRGWKLNRYCNIIGQDNNRLFEIFFVEKSQFCTMTK